MLSDACFEFLTAVGDAARQLAEEAHRYSSPDNPIPYGEEIDALRRASVLVAERPTDIEAATQLLRLAATVLRFHDTPPDTPEWNVTEGEMLELVRLFRLGAEGKDEGAMSKLVEELTKDGPSGEEAASGARTILQRLAKPTYDAAIKIITDIGSATVKRLLGL